MLRPNQVIDYCKERGEMGRSDFDQLMDGINVGGRIIAGGDERVVSRLQSMLTAGNRLGIIQSLKAFNEQRLDPNITYTFDLFAITQLLMVAKNEAFHSTIDMLLGEIQQRCVDGDEQLIMVLQDLREKADSVAHL